MSISQKVLSPWTRFESVIRRVLRKLNPGLGLFDSPVYARVIKARFDGGKVDARAKGISVDVQVLKMDLSDDPTFSPIMDIPLDPATFGDGGVVYSIPKKDSIVRVGFMYSNPAAPFVLSITGERQELPAGAADEYRIETGDGVIVQIKGDQVRIKTKIYNFDLETIIEKLLSHTHLGNLGSPTSPATGSVPPLLPADFQAGGL